MRPSKLPPVPEVEALLSHYGVTERLGRPRERVVTWLALLQRSFEGHAEAGQLRDALVANDVRLKLFYLEGLLKLYVQRYPELTPSFERVKALEDALGALGAAIGLRRTVRGLPVFAECTQWCERQEAAMQRRVEEILASGWLADGDGKIPFFVELIRVLEALEFEGYRRDKKTLMKEIRRRLAKLENASLDMFELQGNQGLHELRRQLRWIPIYCVAVDGLVVTDPSYHPIEQYAEFLNSEVASSPYAKLPEPTREDEPVRISLSLFLANTHFISELGRLKDSGEVVEGVEHALLGSGVAATSIDAKQQALEALRRSPEEQYAVHLLAEKLYKELRKRKFFKRLRADFKE